MHYANGKEVKPGDRVVGVDCCGEPVAGIVTTTIAESDTCNIYIVPSDTISKLARSGECVLASDLHLLAAAAVTCDVENDQGLDSSCGE